MRALQRAFREQDAVIGKNADRIAPDPRKAADQCLTVEPLELVELAAVDDAREDLAHLVGPARVGRDDAVDLLGRVERLARRLDLDRDGLRAIEVADDTAGDAEGVMVVERIMV